MFEKIKNGFITGFSFTAGVISMTLLAVTVGNVNTFNAGEPLSSSKLNENFTNLKIAIEGLNTEVSTFKTSVNTDLDTLKTSINNISTELGLAKIELSNTQTNLTNVNNTLTTTQSAVFNNQSTLTTVSTNLATAEGNISSMNTNLNTLQATDTTLSGRVTTLENSVLRINSVPVGTIAAWHESLPGVPALPNGWVRCNGQTLNDSESFLNGQVIPNLNGQKNIWNSKGLFLRGSIVSGILEDDSFQGHWHSFYVVTNLGGPGTGDNTGNPAMLRENAVKNPISDGINGDPRVSSETKPVNMSVVWIMKVK